MSVKVAQKRVQNPLSRVRKREFPYVFSTSKRMFQIVVKMMDVPGALESVLHALDKRINLIESGSYSIQGGEAIWCAFGEVHSPDETPKSLETSVASSPLTLACQVTESSDGLLVDSFHKGMEMENGERLMLFTWAGISGMFDRMAELFGTGAEVMLFYEGVSIGEVNTTNMIQRIGRDVAMRNMPAVIRMLSATGLGDASLTGLDPSGVLTVRIDDCFECSSRQKARHECSFIRGLLSGSSKALLGIEVHYTETKCRLKGDGCCEFSMSLNAP